MTDYSEEISAYVTEEIKDQFRTEAEDFASQSELLRQILRERYANQKAEETAEELRVETRLEGVAARLMEDMADHRAAIDDDISLAAIYSIAQFEALKIADVVKETAARDAINKATKRVHDDDDIDVDTSASTIVDEGTTENESGRPSMDGKTETGFDLSWRNSGERR